jgi:hypothetical protein
MRKGSSRLSSLRDLVPRPHVIRYRRERWLTPDGETIIAPLPAGVRGHFGAELRHRSQYHQGQTTVARLVRQLRAIGIDVSKRKVMRMPIGGQEPFVVEARGVLRAGLRRRPRLASTTPVADTRAPNASARRSAMIISPG